MKGKKSFELSIHVIAPREYAKFQVEETVLGKERILDGEVFREIKRWKSVKFA